MISVRSDSRQSGGFLIPVDPLGNVTTTTYDANGHRTGSTDANGNLTRFETNAQGQVVKSIDALGNVTSYAYGGSGCPSCGGGVDKLTSLTDANGQTTTFAYDPLGRLTGETDPLGHATTYAYDAKGHMVAKTDANGATIRYAYDALGRLVKKSYPDGAEESFSYDAKGNLLAAANAHASYAFTYDAAGRITSVSDGEGRVIQYSYDTAGKRTKMVAPDGKTLLYDYDAAGRLREIRNGGNYLLSYDTLGRRSSLTFPNGVTTSYAYDSAGRLTNLTHKNAAGTVVASNGYTHDKIGNRLKNTTPERTLSYAYDAVYQLTEARSSAPGYSNNNKGKGTGIPNATEQQKEFYAYDLVGNRIKTDKVTAYEHNAGNAMLRADNTTFRYDNNGNLIEKTTGEGTTTYVWDYENRLVKVVLPSGATVAFKYDPLGRRIEKAASENGATTVTRYVYDNEDILYETDEAGKIGNRYIHGPSIDEPLALIQGKETYYYHADGLGSIVALTDKAGKVVQTYEYDSLGNLKDLKNRIKQPYTYSGREFDRETGHYYYRARYYDAAAGRFVSKDPIGFAGGDVNLYRYVQNSPLNFIDPFGKSIHFTMSNVGGAAAIVAGSLGRAIAKTDCKDGYYYKAEYFVVGIGLAAGVDISYIGKFNNCSSELYNSFTIDGDYPNDYESYINVEGKKLSYLFGSIGIGEVNIGVYDGGRRDVKVVSSGSAGSIGLSLFSLKGVHLLRSSEPKKVCCSE